MFIINILYLHADNLASPKGYYIHYNFSENISGSYIRIHFKFMPYNLFELTQMSREQLEKVAQEHQIKNIKKFTDENLSYAILDAQATAASQEPIEKPKGKRGRPRKSNLPEQAKPAVKETKKADPEREKGYRAEGGGQAEARR